MRERVSFAEEFQKLEQWKSEAFNRLMTTGDGRAVQEREHGTLLAPHSK